MIPSMKTQFDISTLPFIYETSNNYKVVTGRDDVSDRCFIFFSSNGIYFPNTEDEFHRTIILADRYEWESLSPPRSEYRKAIFVRDIRKTWYVDGISGDRNSIDSLYDLLREETRGFSEVVCVGSSAGGYAATLFGLRLNAQKIFNISGFFEIVSQVDEPTNLALQVAQHVSEKAKWFDLSLPLKEGKSAIYYFYPQNSQLDKAQAQIVENVDCVRAFAFNEETHGVCAQNFVYPTLFVKSKIELDSLFHQTKHKSWGRFEFSVLTLGPIRSLLYLGMHLKKKILKLMQMVKIKK